MGNDLLSPIGIITLIVAGMIDVAGWVCIILVAVFGIGPLLGQIVNVAGCIVIGVFLFLQSGTTPSLKGLKSTKTILIIAVAGAAFFFLHIPVGGLLIVGALKNSENNNANAEADGEGGDSMAGGIVKKFLKKQWKKFIAEICPILGDLYPGFTMMVYSELK